MHYLRGFLAIIPEEGEEKVGMEHERSKQQQQRPEVTRNYNYAIPTICSIELRLASMYTAAVVMHLRTACS